jgi:integrase
LVFCNTIGKPIDPRNFAKQFERLLKQADLPHVRFHDMRHSHATLLLMEHVAVKVVSERLGHSSINITQDIYSHVLPEMQKEAADAIDRVFAKAAAEQLQAVNDTNVIDFAARAAARKKTIPCA